MTDVAANKTTHPVLDLPLDKNDADAPTVREYLKTLLHTLLEEEEGFSGKRPLGNSGWMADLEKPLIIAGFAAGEFDEDGYIVECDSRTALKVLQAAVADL